MGGAAGAMGMGGPMDAMAGPAGGPLGGELLSMGRVRTWRSREREFNAIAGVFCAGRWRPARRSPCRTALSGGGRTRPEDSLMPARSRTAQAERLPR